MALGGESEEPLREARLTTGPDINPRELSRTFVSFLHLYVRFLRLFNLFRLNWQTRSFSELREGN